MHTHSHMRSFFLSFTFLLASYRRTQVYPKVSFKFTTISTTISFDIVLKSGGGEGSCNLDGG